jgi:hypothetical protein
MCLIAVITTIVYTIPGKLAFNVGLCWMNQTRADCVGGCRGGGSMDSWNHLIYMAIWMGECSRVGGNLPYGTVGCLSQLGGNPPELSWDCGATSLMGLG